MFFRDVVHLGFSGIFFFFTGAAVYGEQWEGLPGDFFFSAAITTSQEAIQSLEVEVIPPAGAASEIEIFPGTFAGEIDEPIELRAYRAGDVITAVVRDEAGQVSSQKWEVAAGATANVEWNGSDSLVSELVEIPLEGLVIWLRGQDVMETGAEPVWPDARWNSSEAEISGTPVLVEGEGASSTLVGLHADCAATLSIPWPAASEASYFALVTGANSTGQRLWRVGSGSGASWNAESGLWTDDFATETARSVAVNPDRLVQQIMVESKASGWTMEWNEADLMTFPGDFSFTQAETKIFSVGGVGNVAVAEFLVYNRILTVSEKQKLDTYLATMGQKLEASLMGWVHAQAGDNLDFGRLNELVGEKIFYPNTSPIPPSGPTTWYVDNQRGNSTNDGRSAKNAEQGRGPFHELDDAYIAAQNGDTIVIMESPVPYKATAAIQFPADWKIYIEPVGYVMTEPKSEQSNRKLVVGDSIKPLDFSIPAANTQSFNSTNQ